VSASTRLLERFHNRAHASCNRWAKQDDFYSFLLSSKLQETLRRAPESTSHGKALNLVELDETFERRTGPSKIILCHDGMQTMQVSVLAPCGVFRGVLTNFLRSDLLSMISGLKGLSRFHFRQLETMTWLLTLQTLAILLSPSVFDFGIRFFGKLIYQCLIRQLLNPNLRPRNM
jgi:hypothetical protein